MTCALGGIDEIAIEKRGQAPLARSCGHYHTIDVHEVVEAVGEPMIIGRDFAARSASAMRNASAASVIRVRNDMETSSSNAAFVNVPISRSCALLSASSTSRSAGQAREACSSFFLRQGACLHQCVSCC